MSSTRRPATTSLRANCSGGLAYLDNFCHWMPDSGRFPGYRGHAGLFGDDIAAMIRLQVYPGLDSHEDPLRVSCVQQVIQ